MSGTTRLILADTNNFGGINSNYDYFDSSVQTYKTKMFPSKKSLNANLEYYFKRPRETKMSDSEIKFAKRNQNHLMNKSYLNN